jgi:hypothetical protein
MFGMDEGFSETSAPQYVQAISFNDNSNFSSSYIIITSMWEYGIFTKNPLIV